VSCLTFHLLLVSDEPDAYYDAHPYFISNIMMPRASPFRKNNRRPPTLCYLYPHQCDVLQVIKCLETWPDGCGWLACWRRDESPKKERALFLQKTRSKSVYDPIPWTGLEGG
jgi:hypothetical protein